MILNADRKAEARKSQDAVITSGKSRSPDQAIIDKIQAEMKADRDAKAEPWNDGDKVALLSSFVPAGRLARVAITTLFSRGSTGRTVALSLVENLAMQEIKKNPSMGKAIPGMKPGLYPCEIFEMENGEIQYCAFFRLYGKNDKSYPEIHAIWGYHELCFDENHYAELAERNPRALKIYFERKKELTKE